MGCVQRHFDLADIGVDGECLMLGERDWSEDDREDKDCERFHSIPSPLEGFDYESCCGGGLNSARDCLWSNSGWLGDTRKSSRYAHRAGPDPEAERQDSTRECIV